MNRYRFSIDLGETFTDFVLLEESGLLHIKKIPTTFHDPTANLTEEICNFLSHSKVVADQVGQLVVGMSIQLSPERAISCALDLEMQLKQNGWKPPLQLITAEGEFLTTREGADDPRRIMHPSRIGGITMGRYFGTKIRATNLILARIGGASSYLSILRNASSERDQALDVAGKMLLLGGNSLLGLDENGALSILPEHADHRVGPACFNRGGMRPTLTDVDLILGYLNKDYFLYGAIPLNIEAGRKAIDTYLAQPLNISTEEAAFRVCRGVENYLAGLIRELVGEHPEELASTTLLAFGGAGPVHASEIANQLGIREFVVPVGAGVSSALGYLLVKPNNDLDWKLPETLQRAGYYNLNREGDFPALKGYRRVYYNKDMTPCGCPIYDRAKIRAEDSLSGPAVIEGPETTLVIRERSYAQMDTLRNLRVQLHL